MDSPNHHIPCANTSKEPDLVLQPFIDYDGMHLEILGWFKAEKRRRWYLIRYTRPEIKSFSTHALMEDVYLPEDLLNSFIPSKTNDMSNPENQGGQSIRMQDILRVLDIAWYSSFKRECTSSWLDAEQKSLHEVLVLMEWRHDGVTRVTWEFAEIFVQMMESKHYVHLLDSWAVRVDRRHDHLVDLIPPPKEVSRALGDIGWQFEVLQRYRFQ